MNVLPSAALIAAAALAVHELRYLLAYGGGADEELRLQGHAYLQLVSPSVGVLFALASASFILRLCGRGARVDVGPPPPFRRRWAAASAVLVFTYVLQECLEGRLEPGHPGGLDGIFGGSGWIAIPLAIALGALIAMTLRATTVAIEGVAQLSARPRPRGESVVARVAAGTLQPVLDPVARHLAGRGPPAVPS